MSSLRVATYNIVFNTKKDRSFNDGSFKRLLSLMGIIKTLQDNHDIITLQGILMNKLDRISINDYLDMFDKSVFSVSVTQLVCSSEIKIYIINAIRKSSFSYINSYSVKLFNSPINVKNKILISDLVTKEGKKIRVVNIDAPPSRRYILAFIDAMISYIKPDYPCILTGDLYKIEISPHRHEYMKSLNRYITDITYPLFDKDGYELTGTYYGLATSTTQRSYDSLIKSDYIFIRNIDKCSNVTTPMESESVLKDEQNRKDRTTSHFCLRVDVTI